MSEVDNYKNLIRLAEATEINEDTIVALEERIRMADIKFWEEESVLKSLLKEYLSRTYTL